MKKILVLAAHPDDETLGLGGTILKHKKQGDNVFVLIFSEGESAGTASSKRIDERKKQAIKATKVLGIKNVKFLDYPDQKLDTLSLLKLAKDIELYIKKWSPEIIYTHFWGDVNQDHRTVFDATLIATRPTPNSKIKKLVCYETPSSTEWGIKTFKPNLFIECDKFMKIKLKALKNYKNEIEKYPHPRSEKAIINRASYWGTHVGLKSAEAFIVIREIF